ncbi:helix-turn-helix domain-containing protein [Pontibacillus litoralis]|uniref:XRE family transcriptional regulator n=1 Tax=Pontibacillus litoralis JSM 072002 TaxID=1385512 RepID=A0A0A5G4T4_9BACI|nr:helix-turn-helix domain-containing protein [Pontibacillus litoralis]KGX87039.1 XRE family transcriptional regulator [Pontibacillus litoralis JSM 072002]
MKKRIWLIRLRNRKNLTQQEVAERAFIDRSYYAQIESGERKPSIDVTQKIAEILHFHYSRFELEANPFRFALEDTPMSLSHCDKELRYTWLFNPHDDFNAEDAIGKTPIELADNDGTRELTQLKVDVLNGQFPVRKRIPFPLSTGVVIYDVYGHPLLNEQGEVIGVATASVQSPSIERKAR